MLDHHRNTSVGRGDVLVLVRPLAAINTNTRQMVTCSTIVSVHRAGTR